MDPGELSHTEFRLKGWRQALNDRKKDIPPPSHCQKPSYPAVSPRSDALLPSLQQPSLSLLPTSPLRPLRVCVFSCFVRCPLRLCFPQFHMQRARSGAAVGALAVMDGSRYIPASHERLPARSLAMGKSTGLGAARAHFVGSGDCSLRRGGCWDPRPAQSIGCSRQSGPIAGLTTLAAEFWLAADVKSAKPTIQDRKMYDCSLRWQW